MKSIKPLIFILVFSTLTFGEAKERLGQFYNTLQLNHNIMGQEGSGYMYRLKYNSPACGGLSYHIGYYLNGDTSVGKTYTLGPATTIDGGVYLGNTSTDANSVKDFSTILGEFYLRLKLGTFKAGFGQGMLDTPMTQNTYSLVPNFYGYYYAMTKAIPRVELEAYYISSMAYGSRAYNDYYLIGESTMYAGASSLAMTNRATFTNMSLISGVTESPLGLIVASFKTNVIPYTYIRLYEYYLAYFANTLYYDAETKLPLFSDYRLVIGLQGLTQTGLNKTSWDADFFNKSSSIVGAKVGFETYDKKSEIYAAISLNGTNPFINTWGGDPIWTSTMYTRNEYRGNTVAYTGHINILDPETNILFGSNVGIYTASTMATLQVLPLEVDAFFGFDFDNGNYIKFVYNFRVSETNTKYDMNTASVLLSLKY